MYNIVSSFNACIAIPVNVGGVDKIEQTDELVIIHYSNGDPEYLNTNEYQRRQWQNPSLPPLNKGSVQLNSPKIPTFAQNTSYIAPKNYLSLESEFEEKSEVQYDATKNQFKVICGDMITTHPAQEYLKEHAFGPEIQEFFQQAEKVRTDLKDVNEEIAQKNNQNQMNERLIKESNKEKSELKEKLNAQIQLSNELFNKHQTSSEELAKNQLLIQEIKTKLDLVKSKLKTKGIKQKEDKETIKKLTSEKQRIESQLKQLETEKCTALATTKQLQTELDASKHEILNLEKKLCEQTHYRNQFMKKFRTSFEESKNLKEEISILEKANTRLKHRIQTLSDKQAQTESEKKEIIEKLSDTERELKNTKKELELSEQERKHTNIAIENISLKNIKLGTDNLENNENINNLKSANQNQTAKTQQILTSTRKTNRLAILIIVSVVAIAAGLAVTCVFTGGLGLVVIPITAHFALTMGNFVFPVLGGFVLIELVAYGKSYTIINNAYSKMLSLPDVD